MDQEIDGAIRDMYYQDQDDQTDHRRVVAMPEASGREWAASFLDEHPEQLAYWSGVLAGNRPHERIPAGTVKSVQRMDMSPRDAVEYLLGSACNHGQALAGVGAEMDFLLRRADAEFMKVTADARTDGVLAPERAAAERTPESSDVELLALQLLDVLARLDDVRGRGGLLSFVRNGGQAQLVAWFRGMSDLMKSSDSAALEGQVLERLRAEIRASRHRGLRDLLEGSVSTTMTAVGAAGAAIEGVQLAQDRSMINILGVSVSTFLIGFGLCQRLGLVAGGFTGNQWPYLYTFSKPATRRRQAKLLDLLENID